MTEDEEKSLADIRQRIDQIDDALLALLAERIQAVDAVRATKAAVSVSAPTAMRPGREAQILRRLIAAREKDLPAGLVTRIWRELISSATRIQKPMTLHVSANGDGGGTEDLAREHFGAGVPMARHAQQTGVIDAVASTGADVGVLAVSGADRAEWPQRLLDCAGTRPRVIAGLPFVGSDGTIQALVIGHAATEPTGDDSMVVAVRTAQADHDAVAGCLEAAGLGAAMMVGNDSCTLYSVDGWLEAGDPRLTEAVSDSRIAGIEIVGAYANPVCIEESS